MTLPPACDMTPKQFTTSHSGNRRWPPLCNQPHDPPSYRALPIVFRPTVPSSAANPPLSHKAAGIPHRVVLIDTGYYRVKKLRWVFLKNWILLIYKAPPTANTATMLTTFEHLRKKIEVQNENIRAAKIKEEQAKKVWEVALQIVKDEEAVKQKLCEDLNNLVQESSNTQYTRLEELKRRLEALNPGRASTSLMPNSTSPSAIPAALTPEVNILAGNATSQRKGDNVQTISVDNQSPVVDEEGRGKKKNLLPWRGGKGIGASLKGRGSTTGWTGAGFDVDTRN